MTQVKYTLHQSPITPTQTHRLNALSLDPSSAPSHPLKLYLFPKTVRSNLSPDHVQEVRCRDAAVMHVFIPKVPRLSSFYCGQLSPARGPTAPEE